MLQREHHSVSVPGENVPLVCSQGQDQMRIVKQGLLEMVPELRVFLGT
jgi:hypothetical protein